MSLVEDTLKEIKERRARALNGKLNCIPSPFSRFKKDFVGIEKGTYVAVTSFTKGGKSQFTSYTFIYEPLLYAYYHKPDLKLTYIYFPLEESKKRIIERFMSFILNRLTEGKYRYSPAELRSVNSDNPLPKEVLDFMNTKEFLDIMNYFEEHVIFSEETNPTGIYKVCRQYAEEHGTVVKKEGKYKDELGNTKTIEVFDYYIPDNPEEYIIPIIDTINIVDCERGMTQKQSMDKLSEYLAKYLRNRYNMCPIVIQQQAFESENNDSFKLGRNKPTVHTLGDSKYIARDANLVFGLNSPARFGLTEYFGYDIKKLKDNVRFLEILINRDGVMGGIIGLFFDGATCTFKELPPPTEINALVKVYNYVENLNKPVKTAFTFFCKSIINKLKL